ncbi:MULTISPECIES: O-antigen translocase [Flavobacterium]|uniref:O-antigen translocase n=1 Tax=Flavobacterium TaxID=237 RepID=UPI001FCC0826|nr:MULTISPECIES: O-antigen translocase [Flavobacterium]UOK41242.1 O-antigen translocase [Flavobacterium enshiense]
MIKIAIGLITSKVIAIFIGPSGMALVGNLRNFFSGVETVSVLGFQNGTVKYVAENERNESELKKIISTALITLFSLAIIISISLFALSSYWNLKIFGSNNQYGFVFKALAIALPWHAANFIFVAIINGLRKFEKVIYISIFGNIISLIITVVLIVYLKTYGALLAVVISPSLLFFVSYYYINTEFPVLKYLSIRHFDFVILKDLMSYTLMALVSGVLGPFVFLAIRNHVIENLGVEHAGYWEAVSRISTYYMMFLTTLVTLYFLPKLILTTNDKETKAVFYSYFKNIIPLFVLALLCIFFVRDLIIRILFSPEFFSVSDLFFWQLIGDVFKALSLILGYLLLAKKMTRLFIVSELLSFTVQYFLSVYLMKQYHIEGVVMAYFITYLVYFLFLSICLRDKLFKAY